jgi:uncharacterized protein YqfA (UPF0365 family)
MSLEAVIGIVLGVLSVLGTLWAIAHWLIKSFADLKTQIGVIAAGVGARVDVLVERLDNFIEAVQANEHRSQAHADEVEERLRDHDERLRHVESHAEVNKTLCPRLRGEACSGSTEPREVA